MSYRESFLPIFWLFLISFKSVHASLPESWKCKNGRELIAFSSRCDAHRDCSDGSDETFVECHKENCDEYQCSYGGCFKKRQLCDGNTDCWDKTDEHPHHCRKQLMAEPKPLDTVIQLRCMDNQRRCPTTDECLDKKYFCDGIKDCSDGSDESSENCIASPQCPSDTFRCAYGGCLANAKACDHEIDCMDGTDEVEVICFEMRGRPQSGVWPSHISRRNATSRTTSPVLVYPKSKSSPNDTEPSSVDGSCIVPSSLNNLQVKTLFNVLPYTFGSSIADSAVVRLSCYGDSRLSGSDVNQCLKGIWQGTWPECTPLCSLGPINKDLSIRAICNYRGSDRSCKEWSDIGTSMTVTCAPGYKPKIPANITETRLCETHDKSGIAHWRSIENAPLLCIPDCGKHLPTVKEHPWNVTIFQSDVTLTSYTKKCTGTIVSPWLVLTDHPSIRKRNWMLYTIAEGSQSASFMKNEEHSYVLHNVDSVLMSTKKHALLKLVNPLILSASVRPICLPPMPKQYPRTTHGKSVVSITNSDKKKIFYMINIEEKVLKRINN